MFVRMHRQPKKCKVHPLLPIPEWDPKSRYLYQQSLKRYLSDPERKALHDSLGKVLTSGRMGYYSNVVLHKHRCEHNYQNKGQ